MYRIITTSGTELGLVDEVRYVKKSAYGAYVQTTVSEATGVAYNGSVYNLLGHSDIADAETVLISKADSAEQIAKLIANQDYIAMMSDIDLESEETEAVSGEAD